MTACGDITPCRDVGADAERRSLRRHAFEASRIVGCSSSHLLFRSRPRGARADRPTRWRSACRRWDAAARRIAGVYVDEVGRGDAQYTEGRICCRCVGRRRAARRAPIARVLPRVGRGWSTSCRSTGSRRPTSHDDAARALDGHTDSGPSAASRRRRDRSADEPIAATIDGIPCTTLARTVADIVRTVPLEAGLSSARRQRSA